MKKHQGFTLIELMIVVAIIGVLSAIAIPAYKNYVTKSEASSALATLKALVTPTELYIQENGDIAANSAVSAAGTTTNANSLGAVTFSAVNTLQFKFNNTSSLDGENLTLSRDNDSGWSCKPSFAEPVIDGCKSEQMPK
ncbi:pilus assembly protein PilA [Photobacterium aquimaris]|uniref:pilin n=1 Tax=Photobacterium aquimaris TaxID=512643 RepID=UPI0007EF6727|nr:pilin [Photobacterium aquimaris]OBU17386.1 pilus assembly protein PilA [Photobacterium aquimaris]PSW00170.1 pilin [Photobacterium aquimaris]